MSNLAWKILTFSILLNICGALVFDVIGINNNMDKDSNALSDVDIYDVGNAGSQSFDSPPVETESNWADNLLGLIGLGFLVDFLGLIPKYLFGVVDMLLGLLPSEAQQLQPYLIGMVTLVYSLSLISIFTGKKLNEEG